MLQTLAEYWVVVSGIAGLIGGGTVLWANKHTRWVKDEYKILTSGLMVLEKQKIYSAYIVLREHFWNGPMSDGDFSDYTALLTTRDLPERVLRPLLDWKKLAIRRRHLNLAHVLCRKTTPVVFFVPTLAFVAAGCLAAHTWLEAQAWVSTVGSALMIAAAIGIVFYLILFVWSNVLIHGIREWTEVEDNLESRA